MLGYLLETLGKVVATLIVNSSVDELLFKAWLFVMGGLAIIMVILEIIYRSESRTVIFPMFFRHKNKHAKYLNEIFEHLIKKE